MTRHKKDKLIIGIKMTSHKNDVNNWFQKIICKLIIISKGNQGVTFKDSKDIINKPIKAIRKKSEIAQFFF